MLCIVVHTRPSQRGFTLVEILVVMFVVAVMVSVAVLELGGRDRDEVLHDQAERLRLTMELARDRALIGATEWGLRIDADGYDYLQLDPLRGRWEAREDSPFGRHDLPDGMQLEVLVESDQRPPQLATGSTPRAGRDTPARPSLVLLSSGEMTPFEIRVSPAGEGRTWRVFGDGLAAVATAPAS